MTPEREPDALREQSPPYAPPPEIQRLIDELYREELRDARAMPPEEKILAGQQLFESACRITLSGIRLGMNFCLATGADVTVTFQRTVAVGKIRYCRLDRDDSFQAALELEDVLTTA